MMNKIIQFAMLLIYTTSVIAAPTCHKTGSVCTDTTPSKMISGVAVTLAQVGGCWQYADTYDCIKPDAVNYCAAISQVPGCSQTGSTCAVMDTQFGTGCMQWANTYQCGAGLPTPANTTVLNTSYTIGTNSLNSTACATYASNPTCSLASHTCTDTAPSKVINGATVTLAQAGGCWNYTDSYSCVGAMQSNCAPLIAKGCTLASSQPVQYGLGGVVTLTADTYNCPGAPGPTSSVMNCGQQQFCMGGNCMNTGHAPNTALGSAAAALELVRQAGNYMNPTTLRLFAGAGESCRDKLGGLGNCCQTSLKGAAESNAQLLKGAQMQVGVAAASKGLAIGSAYVYDSLMPYASAAYSYVATGFASAFGAAASGSAAVASGSAGAAAAAGAGFTTLTTSAGAGGAAGGAATTTATTSYSGYLADGAMWLAVAVFVYDEVTSCTQEEHALARQMGLHLCRYVKTECSMSTPFGCNETRQSYCCFNSLLSKIINDAGGPQLGRAAADCTGFTMAQFAMLDLSKVDFSPFVAQIMANVHMPSVTGNTATTQSSIQNQLHNYYTKGHP